VEWLRVFLSNGDTHSGTPTTRRTTMINEISIAIVAGNQDGVEAVSVYLRENDSLDGAADWVGPARDAATHTFSLRAGASEQEIEAYYAAYAAAAETAASEVEA
jgi:hypothetical protein